MDTRLHHQFSEISAQIKTVGDLLAEVESNQGPLLNGLLDLPDTKATPPSAPNRQDALGEMYLERLIRSGGAL